MDANYVKDRLGPALTSACAQVARLQPEDPIEWLSDYLRHFVKLQELSGLRKAQHEARQRLLMAAATEEARLRQLREEEERLEAMRRPNEHQLDCRAYLQMLADREDSLRNLYSKPTDYGAAALTAVSGDLARMVIPTEVRWWWGWAWSREGRGKKVVVCRRRQWRISEWVGIDSVAAAHPASLAVRCHLKDAQATPQQLLLLCAEAHPC